MYIDGIIYSNTYFYECEKLMFFSVWQESMSKISLVSLIE